MGRRNEEMPTDVIMPQMGESIFEGTITKWLKKPGDSVQRDQPLFEISTDKVDAEIPSPAAGTLLEIRNKEGETVPVNQVVATIGDAGEQPAAAPAAAAPAPAVPAATPGAAPQPTSNEGKREETAREGEAAAPEVASPEHQPRPEPAASAEQATEAEEEEEVQRDSGESAQAKEIEAGEAGVEDRLRKFSSPLVRSIAAKEGVDLEQVQGTGTHGRVTKDDILGYLEQRQA